MKTETMLQLWAITSGSKLTKVSGRGKIRIARNINAMRGIVMDFEAFRKDAMERLKPDGYEEASEKAEKWRQWNAEKKGYCPITNAEIVALNALFAAYNADVEECLKIEASKEHDVTFEKLTEDDMEQYLDSNDFSAEAAGVVMENW